ncbi:MAG: ABC transporter ATP-binding protein [Gordonia sp. (in: high G+C Gram-positive bacteria)]
MTAGYGDRQILKDLSVDIPHGSLTMIIGPNGCGKSTLLSTFARILKPRSGAVSLNGADLSSFGGKALAQQLSLLPQSTITPPGIQVSELVARGRYPYQRLLHQWSEDDERAVVEAMAATRTTSLAGQYVDELSGGQRQRVWLAMLLAQQTDVMLLDEPTSFLDISHQYELLELLKTLRESGKTQVAIVHDLNQAARYATHLVVMKDGVVVRTGAPDQVVTEEMVREVFELESLVVPDPVTGTPSVVPLDPRASSA